LWTPDVGRIFGAGTPPQPRQGVVDFNQLTPRN
jgi:hypothetical protein